MRATQELAQWAVEVSYDALPRAVVTRSRDAVIDTAAAILAGVREEVTQIVAAIVTEDGCRPVAAQLGTGLRTSPESAALVNGISGHALDYDDVSASIQGHPSVVVLPAALAAAEMSGASGRDLLTAYAVGVEVMARVSFAVNPQQYRAGWHSTATLGVLGAAMAAGRLLGLNATQMTAALAIAASEASGTRQNFGTMTKPFHAGHAARGGVHAARLAQRGMTASSEALEGPLGFLALFSGGTAGTLARPGAPWDLDVAGLSVKRYPCCYAMHRAIDGVFTLRGRGLRPEQIEQIAVTVPWGGLSPLIYERATTGLEGKFCMSYTLAAALWDGRLGLETFTDTMVARPDVQQLAERVSALEDPDARVQHSPIDEGHVDVRVRTRDGSELTERVEHPRGAPARPISSDELRAKYRDCAATVLEPAQAERSLRALEALDTPTPVSELVAELTLAKAGVG